MKKEIELLKDCAEIFHKMDQVLWNDDSCWNELNYEKVSLKVSQFIKDKICECQPFNSCQKCSTEHSDQCGAEFGPCPVCDKKKTVWKDRLRANHKKEYWALNLSTNETKRLFYDKKSDRWYLNYSQKYWHGHNTMYAEIKPPELPR